MEEEFNDYFDKLQKQCEKEVSLLVLLNTDRKTFNHKCFAEWNIRKTNL